MPNQIGSFLNGCKIAKHYPENSIVFEDSVAGVQAANGNMTSIGGEASTLHEAKYIFKDFTIDTLHRRID
jgi:beta-phosphoglucomutase